MSSDWNGMRKLKSLSLSAVLIFGLASMAYAVQKEMRDVVAAALNKGDTTAAIKHLLPLAKRGDAEAQFMLVSVLQTRDQKQAIQWLAQAAANKYPAACHILGLMYLEGNGLPKNETEGHKWLRCAAQGGDAGAQVALGLIYRNGPNAIQDDREAAKWFRQAADQGHAEGQFRLAGMYRYGYGVKQDQAELVRLLRLAVAQGHTAASKALAELRQ
jgi:hypothetical protein